MQVKSIAECSPWSKFNILADRFSRILKPKTTEWSLKQSIANAISQMTEIPNIDLFATMLNHKLPLYVSPIPDKYALAIDALTMNWNHSHTYAFPLFHDVKKSTLFNSTFIKLPVVSKTIVLSFFEWPFYTGFTVNVKYQQLGNLFSLFFKKIIKKLQ